jgi:hypothetical protein
VAVVDQPGDEIAPDEPGTAGDGDELVLGA